MFEHTNQEREQIGQTNDAIVWIKAHMTTRCGPINNTHDKCDNEARTACDKEYLPMPTFPLHEESFVLLDENNHLVEGDPRRATQRRALTTYFNTAFAQSKLKGNDTPSAVNAFVKFNGGPLHNNTDAQLVLDSDDNAAIRLMIRARANCFPTATTLHHREPITHPDDFCLSCKNNHTNTSETTIHALVKCPALLSNNTKFINQITSLLLDIQDPLATTWSKKRPPISTTQETLDQRWPDTFLLTKQPIIYKESKPEKDPHENNTCQNPDNTIDIEAFKKINVPGETKIIGPPPIDPKDFTYAITMKHHPTVPPVKLLRFWEYVDHFKHPDNSFPEALKASLHDECDFSAHRDTGVSIDHSMYWATDWKLTAIIAKCLHISIERFSSMMNFQPLFKKSYSARKRDVTDFSLHFDGLKTHPTDSTSISNSNATPRSFLESSYNNCEYDDNMIKETMEGCFNSLAEADSLGIPVRHVFLLPFAPAKFTHTTFHNMQHQRPNDCRILLTLPESTYSFWMFGYWLGRNKLAKNDRLAYQDGNLAFFIMDNVISRETQPITEQTLKLFAQWSRTQQPDYFQDQARWQNELANVPRTQSSAHDNLDYPTLRATAERWLSSISGSAIPPLFHFSLPEISTISPPRWLIEELCLGRRHG